MSVLWLLAGLAGSQPALADAACDSARFDATVQVAHVYDGDTVRLSDGRRLRFIGIDTPELGRDGQQDEPLAQAARQRLLALLRDSSTWRLVYDAERQDRYGRLLAHPYDRHGNNLSRRLLEEGLGRQMVIPPNLRFLDCYRNAEQQARSRQAGVWARKEYQPLPAQRLLPEHAGYRMVQGRVSRIGDSRSAIWLNMGSGFAVRIVKDDLQYFAGHDPRGWLHRDLIVRGYLYRHEREWRMRVRHPAAIEVLQASP